VGSYIDPPGFRPHNDFTLGIEADGPVTHPDDPKGLGFFARRDIDHARRLLAAHGLEAKVQRKAPIFRPGDVLVVRFTDSPVSTPYTYVRSRRDWPGDGARKSDAEMADLWREGKAALIARDGQPLRAPLRVEA
jgi:hypothetical protein